MNAHQGTSTDGGLSDQLDRVADSVDVSQASSKLPQGWLSRLVEHGRCGRDRSYAYPMGAYQYGLPFTKAGLATVTAECLIC